MRTTIRKAPRERKGNSRFFPEVLFMDRMMWVHGRRTEEGPSDQGRANRAHIAREDDAMRFEHHAAGR